MRQFNMPPQNRRPSVATKTHREHSSGTVVLIAILLALSTILITGIAWAAQPTEETQYKPDDVLRVTDKPLDVSDIKPTNPAPAQTEEPAIPAEETTTPEETYEKVPYYEEDVLSYPQQTDDYTPYQTDTTIYEAPEQYTYTATQPTQPIDGTVDGNLNGAYYEASDFKAAGLYTDASGYNYTYYSQNVLPGGGLDIPGRHVDSDGYVCDENGNVCVASSDLPQGTTIEIPFGNGTGVVYDSGAANGYIDVYTAF